MESPTPPSPDLNQLPVRSLAYIGDAVYELHVREDMLKGGVMNGLARTWKDPQKFLYDVHKGLWAHHNKLNPNVV